MSYVNILGQAPDNTSKRVRVNQQGQMLAATADFPPNGSVLLGTTYATALQADSLPLAKTDPNHRPGWYYSNTLLGNKINWYYFDGTATNLTYGALNQLTCVMTCDGAPPPGLGGSGVINVPFFVVYTKTGKTVIYQSLDTIEYIRGQKVLFYFSNNAFSYPQNPDQLREVACPILESPSRPTPGDDEEIQYITLHSDSAFAATTFTGVISQLGFQFNSNTVEYRLDAPVSSEIGSDVNITNTFLDTHATLYLNGTPVDSGTNALPVIISGSSVVQISATNGDDLTATSNALNVWVDGGIPISSLISKAVVSQIVDINNVPFTNTTAGALDVSVVNTAAVSNAALDKLTFTPIETNVNYLQVQQRQQLSTRVYFSTDFTTLNDGGYLIVPVNTSKSSLFSLYGAATVDTTGTALGVSLVLQVSADGVIYYSTSNSVYITSYNPNFAQTWTICVPYARLLISGGNLTAVSFYSSIN
jgi:hypothetical protein